MPNTHQLNDINLNFDQTITLPNIVVHIIRNFAFSITLYFDGHIPVQNMDTFRLDIFHAEITCILSFVEIFIRRITILRNYDPPLNHLDYVRRYISIVIVYYLLDGVYTTTSRINNHILERVRIRGNNDPAFSEICDQLGRVQHIRLQRINETLITYLRSIEQYIVVNDPNFVFLPLQWYENYR